MSDSLKKYPNNCVVLLNTPNNPTGQVYSAEEYQALAKVAKK